MQQRTSHNADGQINVAGFDLNMMRLQGSTAEVLLEDITTSGYQSVFLVLLATICGDISLKHACGSFSSSGGQGSRN